MEEIKSRLRQAVANGDLQQFQAILNRCSVETGEQQEVLNAMDDDGWTLLHHAARHGQVSIASWLMDDGEDGGQVAGFERAMAKSKNGSRALHLAAAYGHVHVFEVIVDGIEVDNGDRLDIINAVDNEGMTVLHRAADGGHLEMVLWILSEGGGRRAGFISDGVKRNDGKTALRLAAEKWHYECCEAMVGGSEVLAEDQRLFGGSGGMRSPVWPTAPRLPSNTPRERLQWSDNGLVDVGRHEEDSNSEYGCDRSDLHLAALFGDESRVAFLLFMDGREAGFDKLFHRDRNGCTVLHAAAQGGDLSTFKGIVKACQVENGERRQLLNAVNHSGRTVLHLAASHGRNSIVSYLLSRDGRDAGFDKILHADKLGYTALHAAAQGGDLETFKTIVNGSRVGNSERRELLNAEIYTGRTVLHLAAFYGHDSIVSYLLSHEGRAAGFDKILHTDNFGSTALHVAVEAGRVATCQAIVNGLRVDNGERQAMFNAVDKRGRSILRIAMEKNDVLFIQWLLSNAEGGGRSLGLDSDWKPSALLVGAQEGGIQAIDALLSHCTKQERMNLFLRVDEYGRTALHLAAQSRSLETMSVLLSYLESSLVVNAKDSEGMTVLHRLISDNNNDNDDKEKKREIVELLVRGGRSQSSQASSSSTTTTTTTTPSSSFISLSILDPNIGVGGPDSS